METVATSTDGAARQSRPRLRFQRLRLRAVHARVVVHKTAEASLDEGSLGAVVDLNTGNPLGGQSGLTLALIGAGLATTISVDNVGAARRGPDRAGAIAEGTFGIVAIRRLFEHRHAGARQQHACAGRRRASIRSTARRCFYTPRRHHTGGVYIPSAVCDQAAPRLPSAHSALRLECATTASGSASPAASRSQPNDGTGMSIDGLYRASRRSARRNGARCCCAATSARSTCSISPSIRTTR